MLRVWCLTGRLLWAGHGRAGRPAGVDAAHRRAGRHHHLPGPGVLQVLPPSCALSTLTLDPGLQRHKPMMCAATQEVWLLGGRPCNWHMPIDVCYNPRRCGSLGVGLATGKCPLMCASAHLRVVWYICCPAPVHMLSPDNAVIAGTPCLGSCFAGTLSLVCKAWVGKGGLLDPCRRDGRASGRCCCQAGDGRGGGRCEKP